MIFNLRKIAQLAGGGKGLYDRLRATFDGSKEKLTDQEVKIISRIITNQGARAIQTIKGNAK